MSSIELSTLEYSSIPLDMRSCVLNTAHFCCIICCMEVRSSPVVEFPLLFLILSNRSIILSVFDLLISIFLEFGFTFSLHVRLAALPKTTRSINEFVPNLLAPCTETHAASPTAIKPSHTLSGFSFVGLRTSVL